MTKAEELEVRRKTLEEVIDLYNKYFGDLEFRPEDMPEISHFQSELVKMVPKIKDKNSELQPADYFKSGTIPKTPVGYNENFEKEDKGY